MPSSSVTLSIRLYEILLRVYPRAFRQRFGESMAKVFEESCQAAFAESGAPGVLGLWRCAFLDLASSSLGEHWSRYGAGLLKSRWAPAAVTAVIASAGPVVFGGSGFLYLWGWLLVLPLATAIRECCVQGSQRRFTRRFLDNTAGSSAALGLCCGFTVFFLFTLAAMLPAIVESSGFALACSWGVLPAFALWIGTLPFFRQDYVRSYAVVALGPLCLRCATKRPYSRIKSGRLRVGGGYSVLPAGPRRIPMGLIEAAQGRGRSFCA